MRVQLGERSGRGGFTLVELLVVMTIIAVLAALTVGASMRIITVQDEANTKTLVKKLDSVFQKQWQAVVDKAWKEPIPAAVQATILNAAGGDSYRARVIYVKLRLKQEFPMKADEVVNPTVLPALPTYVQALAGAAFPTPGGPEENSACLLMALNQARSGIQFNPSDLGANALIEATTNNAGLKMIVDSWGKPVVFFRWPTFGSTPLNELDASNPGQTVQQQKFRDPQDPNGLLLTPSWWPTGHVQFESAPPPATNLLLHSLHDANGQPYEYYMVPVIASGGPDKTLGVNFPDMGGATTAAQDNIYSYNLR